ncbi:hypothetical protein OAO90_05605 [Candidatus Pelagibacter ubique]|nr:hypothetical protein [Candidatus Pelagibacter ubique]
MKNIQDNFISGIGNMEQKLKEKVRRRNKLVMEIQGSVVVTKK